MKSNIEKVYSKLPKTELAKVDLTKVELGLVDDAKKEGANLIKLRDELGEYTRAILNAKGGLSKSITKVEAKYSSVNSIIKKYETQLKELGIDGEPAILRQLKDTLSQTQRLVKTFEKDFL
tara:strand:+ start:379 stop:741 length:363 start_codon:yes stop_codon:yes gene_type:complete